MRAMESRDPAPAAQAEPSEDDFEACIRVLRAIDTDRAQLTRLTREQRRELLTLAGLVAKPERHESRAEWRRRSGAPSAKPRRRTTASWSTARCCAFSGAAPVYAPLRLEPPAAADGGERVPSSSASSRATSASSRSRSCTLLRLAVRAVRRFQLREARADGGLAGPLRRRHGLARQDRLPGGAEAAARRRARRRHDALSRRRCEPLRQGAGLSASFAGACRSSGSICGTRRASSCSRDSSPSGCRVSTTS